MSQLESNVKSTYEAASEIVNDLAKLGATWVRYGLAVGESSLQTSAQTLEEAARTVRRFADKLKGA